MEKKLGQYLEAEDVWKDGEFNPASLENALLQMLKKWLENEEKPTNEG